MMVGAATSSRVAYDCGDAPRRDFDGPRRAARSRERRRGAPDQMGLLPPEPRTSTARAREQPHEQDPVPEARVRDERRRRRRDGDERARRERRRASSSTSSGSPSMATPSGSTRRTRSPRASIDRTATVRIMTKLERGLDDFMDQKDGRGGQERQARHRAERSGRRCPSRDAPSRASLKWYVAPTRRLVLQRRRGSRRQRFGQRVAVLQLLGANVGGSAVVRRELQPRRASRSPVRTRRRASSSSRRKREQRLSRALTRDHRGALGLLFGREKNPQANYTFRANASAGLEFDLVPRQTVNQKNFGFRCAVGPEFQRYDATNVEGIDRQFVGRQFCDVFLSWHFQPIDLGEASGRHRLARASLPGLLGGLSATWRVTDNLIALAVGLVATDQPGDQRGRSRRTPSTPIPVRRCEASMLAAVQQGYTAPFGLQSGLSIKYIFGNGSLSIEDQRWKGTSNLR